MELVGAYDHLLILLHVDVDGLLDLLVCGDFIDGFLHDRFIVVDLLHGNVFLDIFDNGLLDDLFFR